MARRSGVRNALLFVLIRALYCDSLQCVRFRTRGHEDEPKCGSFFLGGGRITVVINVNTIVIL